MKRYTYLTEHERYPINVMNKQDCTLTEIAKTMDRNKSTISREVKRNARGKGYRLLKDNVLVISLKFLNIRRSSQ